ncbi:NADH-quinone oxidoreductase subunit N [Mucilaginibacter galii]|uniref:NADH-quinone oxidoreductase subunit N n=1 Tax=Mucilaginibacter galii TaxID=2005073 RepID=A0A917MZD6_9SPHI|nr:NADH-quinone oxidoreductase subunit N [Mucilaginibacter galii]GGI48876.1 NADH-quinone oxidoreductase subunit N [Mucilaginibacter galii]
MQQVPPYLTQQLDDVMSSLLVFKPELCLAGLFLLVLGIDLIYRKNSGKACRMLGCAGMLLVLAADLGQYLIFKEQGRFLFINNLILNHDNIVLKMIIDAVTFTLLVYFPWDHQLKTHKKGLGDAYTIIIASVLGLHLMVMSATLLTMFLSIEMVSIASYLLVAYRTESNFSAEAALKYVLFGMAASAVMLYGISLFYGFSGSINLYHPHMVANLQAADPTVIVLAVVLILAGIGFKLSFVPLHFWVPDVYQGASTPVTAYLSTLPKIAGFGLLVTFLRPFMFNPTWSRFDFTLILSIAAIVTMIAGNFAAIWQQNVKRILAYSSVGHTGFALMAIVTFTPQSMGALSFYLIVYAIANIGVLGLATYFANAMQAHTVNDYKGLGTKYPIASVCFVVLLISLTGIPVSAGFNAKVLVFSSVYEVYQHGHKGIMLALLVTGAVTTVVSLFYYLKIPLNLFLRKEDTVRNHYPAVSKDLLVMIVILSLIVVLLGIFPDALANLL